MTLALLAGGALSGFALGEKQFNYAGNDTRQWGTQKLENYDVAVRLADPTLEGNSITAVTVPGIATDGVGEFSIWLSSALTLEEKVNAPDILLVSVEPRDNTLRLELAEPYVIPAGGVYVGYSFVVTDLTEASRIPISVSDSDNPDAFLIHTSRSYKSWDNYDLRLAADLQVTLTGAFAEAAVAVTGVQESEVLPDSSFAAAVTIRNHGNRPVSSLEYSYTIDGSTGHGELQFDPALPTAYDTDVPLSIPLPALSGAGVYTWSVSVDKVNGATNADPAATAYGTVYVYAYKPVHRPLVEEYTGTWCGWCTRGILGFEKMNEHFGEEFVGVAFHTGEDVMAIPFAQATEYTGAPSAWIDRTVACDPYFGTAPQNEGCATFMEGIGAAWQRASERLSPVDLSLTTAWDETETRLTANLTATFVRPWVDADLRCLYILTADGLTGPGHEWSQKNYYTGSDAVQGTDLQPLADLPALIFPHTFNDVAILAADNLGIPGSLPSRIEALGEYTHSYTFTLSEALNTDGQGLVQDSNRLNVVAAILDARTGRVLNAVKVPVPANTGISNHPADPGHPGAPTVVSEEFYDLTGRPLPSATGYRGLLIKVIHLSDQSTVTIKCINQ